MNTNVLRPDRRRAEYELVSNSNLLTRYEEAFAAAAGARHAVAFAYGRTALSTTLQALDLGAGAEIILSPLTCKVVPLALLAAGLKPVYADIDPNTLNLDLESIKAATTPKTRAILFQHTYGISEGADAAQNFAKERGIQVIEDCAQCLPDSHGGDSRRIAIFSNNLRKPLAAAGGGFVVTADTALADKIAYLRDRLPEETQFAKMFVRAEEFLHRRMLTPSRYWLFYGLSKKYLNPARIADLEEEVRSNITNVARRPSSFRQKQGMLWLRRAEQVSRHSEQCCREYKGALQEHSQYFIPAALRERTLYYFPLRVAAKKKLLQQARNWRVEMIAWPVWSPIFPLETIGECKVLGYDSGSCPDAERIATELVGLPTQEQISEGQRQKTAALIHAFHTP